MVPVDQLGVPTYDELVLVAQRSRVEDDPDVIRLFLSALANGTRAAIANPEAATESILKAGKGLDPKLTRRRWTPPCRCSRPPRGSRSVRWTAPSGSCSPAGWPTTA